MDNPHNIKHIKTEFGWDDIIVDDLDQSDNFLGQESAVLGDSQSKDGYTDFFYRTNSLRQLDYVPQKTISHNSPVIVGCAGVSVPLLNGGDTENTFCIEQGEEKDISSNLIYSKGILKVSSASPSNFICKKELHDGHFEPKLKLEWTTPPNASKIPFLSAPPRAYAYKDIYQNNRKKAVRQREEEERKARQFHSRPAPDFKVLHRRLEDVTIIHRITVPTTPEIIKHSLADKERRKQKKKQQSLEIEEMNSFYVRSDKSGSDLKKYNAIMQLNMEQKQLKLDGQRKKQELDEERKYAN